MADLRRLSPRDLEILLRRVKESHGAVSLRVDGTARMLGQLQLCGLETGVALQLLGAKRRDLLPPPGTPVIVSVLLDDEVVSMTTHLLEPLMVDRVPVEPRVLRAAWPSQPLEFHHRDDVRVATPELPALGATLWIAGRAYNAFLLNLTETGMGLGLVEPIADPLPDEAVVETVLPGGSPLRLAGEIRHCEHLEFDLLPIRVGLVLKGMAAEDREALRRMVQARRTLRSEALREG